MPNMKEHLKQLLEYNPKTGLFTWIASPTNRVLIGSEEDDEG